MLRNVAIVAFASYIESAVGLLVGIVIARTLGPLEYGHYAYAVWLCGVLVTITNSALTTSSIKFLAELRGAQQADIAQVLVYKFLRWQSWAGMLVLGGFIVFVGIDHERTWPSSLHSMQLLTVLAVWARAGFWLRGAIGKGYELFGPENIALVATAVLNLLLTLTLAWLEVGVVGFFASYATLGLISNLLVRWMLHKVNIAAKPGQLPKPLFARVRRHLLLTGILITVGTLTNRAVEMTLLKQYVGTAAVAYFAIAVSLSKGALDLLAGGLSAVLLPSMARNYGQSGARSLERMLVESTRLYWFIGLAVAGLGLTIADSMIRILYGIRYVEAIPALNWQLLISGLLLPTAAANAALTTDDRQLDRIVVVSTAFCVNVALGYLLIPSYGLSGAIASSALSLLFSAIILWAYILRRTHAKLLYWPMVRLLLAAVVSTTLSWSLVFVLHSTWAFILGGLLFCTCYVFLSVVLRTWRTSDFELFANILSKVGPFGRQFAPKMASLSNRYGIPSHGEAIGS